MKTQSANVDLENVDLQSQLATQSADQTVSASNQLPLVSITINNYNYEHFVAEAINSALNQTYPNIEVIVVDDGSTDSSAEIIASYGNQIISVLKENGGQASAMNAGFAASSGDIICILDADDLFLPEKVATVVDFFQKDSSFGWVFTDSDFLQTEEVETTAFSALCETIRHKSYLFREQEIDFRDGVKAGKIPYFPPSTSNLCFSRSLLEKIFPLPEVKGISGMAISDLYIHTLAIGFTTGYFTKQRMGIYRHHGANMMSLGFPKLRRKLAEKNMVTGYWIRQNFPEFEKVSDKFVSKGFSTYLSSSYPKSHTADITCEGLLKAYLAEGSFLKRIKIPLMIVYYWLRLRFQKFV